MRVSRFLVVGLSSIAVAHVSPAAACLINGQPCPPCDTGLAGKDSLMPLADGSALDGMAYFERDAPTPSAFGLSASGLSGGGSNSIFDITILNFAFSPASLTIPVGSTVRWTNLDGPAHTATSTNGFFGIGQPSPNGVFNSGILTTNQTFSYTFTTDGSFNYYCLPHPGMQANITVFIPEPTSIGIVAAAGCLLIRKRKGRAALEQAAIQ